MREARLSPSKAQLMAVNTDFYNLILEQMNKTREQKLKGRLMEWWSVISGDIEKRTARAMFQHSREWSSQ